MNLFRHSTNNCVMGTIGSLQVDILVIKDGINEQTTIYRRAAEEKSASKDAHVDSDDRGIIDCHCSDYGGVYQQQPG